MVNDVLLYGLAECSALCGIAGHHGEAVCMAAPASDHQHHLEIGILLLEVNDLADGGFLGLGDHYAAVSGLGVAETAVGVVDMGDYGRVGEFLVILGEVGQDYRGLAYVRAEGTGRIRIGVSALFAAAAFVSSAFFSVAAVRRRGRYHGARLLALGSAEEERHGDA